MSGLTWTCYHGHLSYAYLKLGVSSKLALG